MTVYIVAISMLVLNKSETLSIWSKYTSWKVLCYIWYIYSIQVFVHSYADIWCTKIGNQILFLGISLFFHVSVKHWLCLHQGLLTLTCFAIDYHVNKDTQFLLFWGVQQTQVFITLQYCKPITGRRQSSVSEGILKRVKAGTCNAWNIIAFIIWCNVLK